MAGLEFGGNAHEEPRKPIGAKETPAETQRKEREARERAQAEQNQHVSDDNRARALSDIARKGGEVDPGNILSLIQDRTEGAQGDIPLSPNYMQELHATCKRLGIEKGMALLAERAECGMFQIQEYAKSDNQEVRSALARNGGDAEKVTYLRAALIELAKTSAASGDRATLRDLAKRTDPSENLARKIWESQDHAACREIASNKKVSQVVLKEFAGSEISQAGASAHVELAKNPNAVGSGALEKLAKSDSKDVRMAVELRIPDIKDRTEREAVISGLVEKSVQGSDYAAAEGICRPLPSIPTKAFNALLLKDGANSPRQTNPEILDLLITKAEKGAGRLGEQLKGAIEACQNAGPAGYAPLERLAKQENIPADAVKMLEPVAAENESVSCALLANRGMFQNEAELDRFHAKTMAKELPGGKRTLDVENLTPRQLAAGMSNLDRLGKSLFPGSADGKGRAEQIVRDVMAYPEKIAERAHGNEGKLSEIHLRAGAAMSLLSSPKAMTAKDAPERVLGMAEKIMRDSWEELDGGERQESLGRAGLILTKSASDYRENFDLGQLERLGENLKELKADPKLIGLVEGTSARKRNEAEKERNRLAMMASVEANDLALA